ncbi:ferredoxin-type protein NapF [Amaricoccus tamworthensis]|uniref:ferredoxin-type protein NapF n=1 Tax=Amaricoccus tamworthensis TaxID=57002 RepID=UPI003C7C0076
MSTPSRRSFLRGHFARETERHMRPPGAGPDFMDLCTRCGDCVSACPESIIIKTPSDGPRIDFSNGACTFCQECAQACPTGALAESVTPGWDWRAEVQDNCFSLGGIACRACEDGCGERAIRFRLQTGGRSVPLIDQDACTGCGECAFVCPAGAITFTIPEPAQEALA